MIPIISAGLFTALLSFRFRTVLPFLRIEETEESLSRTGLEDLLISRIESLLAQAIFIAIHKKICFYKDLII